LIGVINDASVKGLSLNQKLPPEKASSLRNDSHPLEAIGKISATSHMADFEVFGVLIWNST
jgi:hypothetical protein